MGTDDGNKPATAVLDEIERLLAKLNATERSASDRPPAAAGEPDGAQLRHAREILDSVHRAIVSNDQSCWQQVDAAWSALRSPEPPDAEPSAGSRGLASPVPPVPVGPVDVPRIGLLPAPDPSDLAVEDEETTQTDEPTPNGGVSPLSPQGGGVALGMPVAGPRTSSWLPPPQSAAGVVRSPIQSLEGYAAFMAEIQLHPARGPEIRRRFDIPDEASQQRLDAYWQGRFARDEGLFQAWEELYSQARALLLKGPS